MEDDGPFARFKSSVCRRAFSSPEAAAYEWSVAAAVAGVAATIVDAAGLSGVVLDVGCGGGRLAAHMALNGVAVVVGVDPSAAQVERVRRRYRHRRRPPAPVLPVRGSALGLPFGDEVFEGVISSCALKHWPDRHLGVRECVRVARPGRPIVILEIDGTSTADEVRRFTGHTRIPPGLREAYVRFALRTVVGVAPSPRELEAIVVDSGLERTAVEKVSGLPFVFAAGSAPSSRARPR